jgi:hypothetical protein
VISFLPALTCLLFNRVLGADDPPLGAVMGTRGEAASAAGSAPPGAGASSNGVTTVAASASETSSRWARADRERAGASPRARRAASSTGRRTCIHWLAFPCTIPHKRPCTTWRAEVLREVRMNNSRSSGVGRGQFWSTVNRRVVRGVPSLRHTAIRAWNAASKGGTSYGNSSRVTLVKSRNSIGRDCSSVNRKPAIGRASCHCIVMSEAHHTRKKTGQTQLKSIRTGAGPFHYDQKRDAQFIAVCRTRVLPIHAASGSSKSFIWRALGFFR